MAEPKDHVWIQFKLGDYFRRGSHKVAISLPELVSQTNNFSVKNRPGCAPTLERSNAKDLFLAYNVKCHLTKSDPNGHDVKIHFDLSQVTDITTAKNLDVAVNCSCPAFLYWGGQWNSHMRDALEGEARPLLTKPTEKMDLRGDFIICKHIKAVSERILPSVQHNVNNVLRKREVEKNLKTRPPKPRQTLEEKQQEMRDRQQKKKDQTKERARQQKLNEKFKQQLKQNPINDVVKRDEPATEEERKRVPVLPPETIPEPDAHKQHANPSPTPVPVAKPSLKNLNTAPIEGEEPPVVPDDYEEEENSAEELVEKDRKAQKKKKGW